jgi:hypothetical protein
MCVQRWCTRGTCASLPPMSPASVTGILSACRVRLARGSRTLGGSAAYFPGPLGHPSLLVCAYLGHRTPRTGSAPHVRPFTTMRQWLLRPRLTSAHPSRRLTTALARRQVSRSPGVRHVTFAPSTRRIYALRVRVTAGFESFGPLAHPRDASYALRVPRAGALLTASFPRRLAATQLLFG